MIDVHELKVIQDVLVRHIYGTPLLPPGDCVLAIELTPRYILCIHHYIGCS